MSSKQNLDFAIVGGGIGGLVLGLALHQRGINVHIYEAAHHFGEIGAGVGFTPNAVQAMHICHPAVHEAFEKTATKNAWESKQHVWFDFYDGMTAGVGGRPAVPEFQEITPTGQNGCHRAHFLGELVKAFPKELASFGKRLENYKEGQDGLFELFFKDGSTAKAHAIIGCDGIKSHVRSSMFGPEHPCAQPSYTHKYAYRALAPMKDAIEAVGEERALNACFYNGEGGHILTFAINHDETWNVVGFFTDPKEWTDTTHLTAPAHRTDALRDFGHLGPDVKKILGLTKPDLDIWAIFDLALNPPPTYTKGRVCLLGDAAHATSPHHGAGAGMAIEDACLLAELLADEKVQTQQDVEKAFAVYDEVRRPRGNFLVQSSRRMGEVYDGQDPSCKEMADLACELRWRNNKIQNVDVAQMCKDARAKLA